MHPTNPRWKIILPLAILKFLLPFIGIHAVYELQRDEYLYYQQGLHPAWGYLENPPLLSWMATISSWLGGSEWSIKIWPALLGALTLIMACILAARWGGKAWAQAVTALVFILAAFARVHLLFQPNIIDIFAWTACILMLVLFQQSRQKRYWYGFAAAAVIGFYGKYTILFFLAAIAIGWLFTSQRKLFLSRHLYIALGIALLLALPNIYWQYQQNWPLLHHMQELQETQLKFLSPLNFVAEQFLYLLPFLPIWLAGVAWFFFNAPWRWMGITFIALLTLLMLGSAKGYYALGIYPSLIAAGAAFWQKRSATIKWLQPAILTVVILLSLPMIPFLLPFAAPSTMANIFRTMQFEKTGLLRWEDQKDHPLPQDYADMIGWKTIADKAEKAFQQLPDSVKQHTVVYCRHYGQAGALKFYSRDKDFQDRVISDNGSFLLWIKPEMDFRHLLFVGRNNPDADDEVFNHFASRQLLDSVNMPLSRQHGDKLILFRDADSVASGLARTGLAEMKRRFQR